MASWQHDLIVTAPSVITAIGWGVTHWRIQSLTLHINSRMDALLEAATAAAKASGFREGSDAERGRAASASS